MLIRSIITTVVAFGLTLSCVAQEEPAAKPIELEVLKASVGIWDAEIEVWLEGPDSPSIKFKGVETNRPYGEYWIASDFDSEFNGPVMEVHSIVGYDLDRRKMVGTVIDHGPYAASACLHAPCYRGRKRPWVRQRACPTRTIGACARTLLGFEAASRTSRVSGAGAQPGISIPGTETPHVDTKKLRRSVGERCSGWLADLACASFGASGGGRGACETRD